ncbi:ATP-binding protein [Halomonas almeriensis]|uniref:ATP-binding protein n=1 Tax=Halomonas almeriensis TaxID=308163 RepID=UPI0025B46749|nr:ATP-binding protein [Halomonas almeriensis]MDN3552343.1 ATP-binding protein [Halomonas almeriensis]
MSLDLFGLMWLGTGYLSLLFLCATAVDRGWLPQRLVRHPAVHTLALGVYASAWAIHGSLEFASRYGFGYLAYYLGVAGAFLLASVLLVPIQRLTRTHQLSSLADLFAFRFRSRWVGTLMTVVSLLAVLPLLALQIQTMGEAIHRLSGSASPSLLALGFSLLIALFAMLFGARHLDQHARHDGLLVAIALESVVKLVAMLALGGIALFSVFNGPADLQSWLDGAGHVHQTRMAQLDAGQWRTLLLLFFAAAFLMPHMFHVTFAEPLDRRTLLQSSWALPLFLLLMALPIPLIIWASQRLGVDEAGTGAAYLAFQLSSAGWVQGLAFIAGLAAASGTMIIISLALSGMVLNHMVLVAHPPIAQPDLYGWLRWLRRGLIAAVIVAGWLFYRLVGVYHDLSALGLASFVGIAQCLPGMLALLYWPGANRKGMVSGLSVGVVIWLAGLWVPLLTSYQGLVLLPPGFAALAGDPAWYSVALVSLAANILTFILVSLATPTSTGERAAAEACSVDAVVRPMRLPLAAANGAEFKQRLSPALGQDVASREVDRALEALAISPLEARPYALRRLRDRIQANLSGLMGPSVAQDIVDRCLPYQHDGPVASEDIHFVENRLEAYRSRLTGLARELDSLRRYHRRTLTRLPVGLCAFGEDGELLMWNDALASLSGISGDAVLGAHRDTLPSPWGELLGEILATPQERLYKKPVRLARGEHFLTLHRAGLQGEQGEDGGHVILVEDHSDMKWLEDELIHATRLASIGQLATGVAHEIGNPVTGISSLAQNLRHDSDDPATRETAEQIQSLTDRISQIVGSLVGFAHGGRHVTGGDLARTEMKTVIDEALHLIRLARSGDAIDYVTHCGAEHAVLGDAQRLQQVMINLLSNARDASEAGARVIIEAEAQAPHLHLSITDQGSGIDPAVRDHLFEPFTTTKPAGEGTGLGLPLVYSIIAEHNGHIDIESPPAGRASGTRIHLWLPLYRDCDESPHEPDPDR